MSLNATIVDVLRNHAEHMQAAAAALQIAADMIERMAAEIDLAKAALQTAIHKTAEPAPASQEKAPVAEERATPPSPLDPKMTALAEKDAALAHQIKWSEDTKVALLDGIPKNYDHPTFEMAFDTWRKRVQAYRAQMVRPHFREIEKARDAALEKRSEARERQRLAARVDDETGEPMDPETGEPIAA